MFTDPSAQNAEGKEGKQPVDVERRFRICQSPTEGIQLLLNNGTRKEKVLSICKKGSLKQVPIESKGKNWSDPEGRNQVKIEKYLCL